MNRIYLVRHGENTANLTLEFSHRKIDYSLTAKGVMQARQTAEFFRRETIHEIFSSPLKRAVETAKIIAEPHGLPVQAMEAFREVNVGDLEGQKPTTALWAQHDEIIASWKGGHPEVCFPGGEDYPTLFNRIASGLKEILAGKDGRNIIICGHGGIFSFTLRDLCTGLDRSVLEMGIMPNCSVTQLDAYVEGGRLAARMVSFSSIAHLNGDAAKLAIGRP